MLNMIISTPTKKTVKELQTMHSETKMYVDDAVQRFAGVWSVEQERKYIRSVFNHRAASAMVVSVIESAIEASEVAGDEVGKERLQGLFNDGYRKQNLDGLQRDTTIKRFLNDDISVKGTFPGIDGKYHTYNDYVTFSKLGEPVRNWFMQCPIVVTELDNVPDREHSPIFTELQLGTPLNKQEQRNALRTPIAQYVRTKSNDEESIEDVFNRVESYGAKQQKRMSHSELYVQTLMAVTPGFSDKSIGHNEVDAFYRLGLEYEKTSEVPAYSAQNLTHHGAVWGDLKRAISSLKIKGKTPQRTFWAMLGVCDYLRRKNFVIFDFPDFAKAVYDLDRKLVEDSKKQQGRDIDNAATDADREAANDDDRYYWRKCNRNSSGVARTARMTELCTEFEELNKHFDYATPASLAAK